MNFEATTHLFRTLQRELWIVTASSQGRRGGLLASFVSPISIVPDLPRLGVALGKQHHTWEIVQQSRSFVVHLAASDQFDLAWRFGTESGHDQDKFLGLTTRPGLTGSPILVDCPAYLECRVEADLDIGDRTFYLAEVVAGEFPEGNFSPLNQSELIRRANPEQLARLRNQLTADGQVDAAAIRSWREQTHSDQCGD